MIEMRKDDYRYARGGYSTILDISCEHCNQHICYYQKDGPGALRRMYCDRMLDISYSTESLVCPSCSRILGTYTIYEKESRPAFRLYVDAVKHTKTSLSKVNEEKYQ